MKIQSSMKHSFWERFLAVALTLALVLGAIPIGPKTALGADLSPLEADVTTLTEMFPDDNFRGWVKDNVLTISGTDYNATTEATTQAGIDKIHSRTSSNCSLKNISDLTGSGYLTAST